MTKSKATVEWSKLGYFEAKEVDWRTPGERRLRVTQRLRKRVSMIGWDPLNNPIIVRTPLSSTVGKLNKFRKIPHVLIGNPRSFRMGRSRSQRRRSSFLVLDLTHGPPVLTVALQNWSTLNLNLSELEGMGCDVDELVELFRGNAETRTRHWNVLEKDRVLTLSSGKLDGSESSPTVGRFALGQVTWALSNKGGSVHVEVLALPRLNRARAVDAKEWAVSTCDDDEEWRRVLEDTYWRSGAAEALSAMLRLASGESIRLSNETVWMSSTQDASPLVWLPLTRALEQAAREQHRAYVRSRRVARAPTGTLDVSAYMGNLARQRPDLVPVTRFELTRDSPENRLFRAVTRRVSHSLRSKRDAFSAQLCRRLDRVEADFDMARLVAPTTALLTEVGAKPLPTTQRAAFDLCRAAIEGRYPGLGFRGESFAEMEGFDIDIAQLFEDASREVLSRCVRAIDQELQVSDGNRTAKGSGEDKQQALVWLGGGALPGGAGARVNLLPDLIVRRGDEHVAIGDVKYKRPARTRGASNGSFAPMRREDFHQLMAYFMAWPTARWGVVIYPRIEEEDVVDDDHATRLLAELSLPGGRALGVFDLAVDSWEDAKAMREPLTVWINEARPT